MTTFPNKNPVQRFQVGSGNRGVVIREVELREVLDAAKSMKLPADCITAIQRTLTAGGLKSGEALSLAGTMQLKGATDWQVIGIDEKEPIGGQRSVSPIGGGCI